MNSEALLLIYFRKDINDDDDDDDEDEAYVRKLEKIENFAEVTVPRFTDHQFRQNFRMNTIPLKIFKKKLHSVKHHASVAAGHPKIQLEKQAMITIWYLSNMESFRFYVNNILNNILSILSIIILFDKLINFFRSVAGRFGICNSSCWDVLQKICKLILKINAIYKII